MVPGEAYDFSNWPRRDNDKLRLVEAAVEALLTSYGLPADAAQALSDTIYRLYRNLVAQKFLDDQERQYRKWAHPKVCALAVRTAHASGTEVSAFVADAREFAAHMIRLETLERRNLGRWKAIEQASKATWDALSPQERHRGRLYLEGNALPGDNTRRPAREAEFLSSVAGLIEQETGRRISFSSAAPGARLPSGGRHHGVEFDVMMAAANMANYPQTNEAMARRIQHIRRLNPQNSL
jgi:hypothetical protein